MEIPQTIADMLAPIYSPHHLAKIFKEIKGPTLAMWLKREIIKPAVPAAGSGFPTRFNYMNLMEISLVGVLVGHGINSHSFLRDLLNSGREPYPNKSSLVEKLLHRVFDCFLLVTGMRRCAAGEDGADAPPFYKVKGPGDLEKFFTNPPYAIPDWLTVNVGLLRDFVERQLKEL